jgi:hypothetical protein
MASLGIATAWPFFGFGRCIQPAFDALLGIVDDVLAVDVDTVERAKAIVLARQRLSARDAIHVASWSVTGSLGSSASMTDSTACQGSNE